MRKLAFDQFEFDSIYSEQSLEIHVAAKVVTGITQFLDLNSFVVASAGPDTIKHLSAVSEFNDRAANSSVRHYLKRFADIDVPQQCDWKTYVLFVDDLEWDGFFVTPDQFIRYHWLSTA